MEFNLLEKICVLKIVIFVGNKLFLSIGERIPPVAAPRYKRKLITKEDSKTVSINQDTCVNEKTVVSIVPPPRRKNKICSITNTIPIVPSKQNHYFSVNERQANHNSVSLGNSFSNTSFKTKDLVISNQKNYSDLVEDNVMSCFHKLVNIEDCDILDNISNCRSKMSPILGEPRGSHIFDNAADNRVLGTTLENTSKSSINSSSQKQFDQNFAEKEDREKNRVKCNMSENSATIVGVFYKPEFTLKHEELMNEEILFSHSKNKELCSTYLLSSKINYGNKTAAPVPLDEYQQRTILVKDPEENDSGVYFSDTKSPPHVDKLPKSTFVNEELNSSPDVDCNITFYKDFPSNAGDTIDNNTSEESGTQNYQMMLDYFEGQTVKSFREQIASQLQLSSEGINKEKAVDSRFQIEKDVSEKRESSLSVYLKSMLESESLSSYPLSTVDKGDRSDFLIEEFEESKMVEDLLEKKSVPDTCTVPVRLEIPNNNNSTLAPNNHVDIVVDINDVNILPVNIDCNVNFDKNVYATDCTSNTQKNEISSLKEQFGLLYNDIYTMTLSNDQSCNLSKVSNESIDINHHSHYNSELCVENIHISSIPSTQPCNAVTSLIEFFENSRKEPFILNDYDSLQSEEEIDNEDKFESVKKDTVVQGSLEFNCMNYSNNITTENCVEKINQKDQGVKKEDIMSRAKVIECPDAVCKVEMLSVEDTPTVNENSSLSESKTIHTYLKLDNSDYSIENVTVPMSLTTKKGTNFICDETLGYLPLHSYSFQLPIENKQIMEDQGLVGMSRECNFSEDTVCNSNVYSKETNIDCFNNTQDSVNAKVEEQYTQEYLRHENSFCKDFDDFQITEQSYKDMSGDIECSSRLYSNIEVSADKIAKPKCKLTNIPIVIYTDSDFINSSPIGSVELYSSEHLLHCSAGKKNFYFYKKTTFQIKK